MKTKKRENRSLYLFMILILVVSVSACRKRPARPTPKPTATPAPSVRQPDQKPEPKKPEPLPTVKETPVPEIQPIEPNQTESMPTATEIPASVIEQPEAVQPEPLPVVTETSVPEIQPTEPNQTESVQIAPEPNQENIPETTQWHRPRSDERLNARKQMVNWIRDNYGVQDKKILDAMLNVPRHWFVPDEMQTTAYADGPLPIGQNQTISQPFIVAYMTSALNLKPTDKVLEIGTGSGYQAAVLTEFTPYVFSVEINTTLAETAQKTLESRGYITVHLRCGDGYRGWAQYAPFDAIIVTCAADHIPESLLEQLNPGGRMIIPIGDKFEIQHLTLVTKDPQGNISQESMMPARFVPLIRK